MTYSNLKVLKQDDETIEGAISLCAKAQHCHVILEKKPKTIFVKTCKQQTNKNQKNGWIHLSYQM